MEVHPDILAEYHLSYKEDSCWVVAVVVVVVVDRLLLDTAHIDHNLLVVDLAQLVAVAEVGASAVVAVDQLMTTSVDT